MWSQSISPTHYQPTGKAKDADKAIDGDQQTNSVQQMQDKAVEGGKEKNREQQM